MLPTTKVETALLSADSNITTDDITNVAAQTIAGTLDGALQDGEAVQVSFNGGATWNTATSFTVGSRNWFADGNLLNGANILMARVFNADGASAAFSRNYTLDTTAAAPSIPVMTNATDTGESQTDAITSNATPIFTGTAEAGATVWLYDTDGTTVRGSDVADGAGNWTITSSTLAEGDHTLKVRQTDIAGNVSDASTLAVTIDTSIPAQPAAPDLHLVSDTGSSIFDNLTRHTTPTFTGTAESGSTVRLYDTNGSTVLGWAVATGGSWSIPSSTLSEGPHTLTVKATDVAGNESEASSALIVTIDTSAPAPPSLPDLLPQDDSGNSSSDNHTNSVAPVITGTAEAGSWVHLYDTDEITVVGSAVATGGNWSITAYSLAAGLHTLTARAIDAAGNVSSASSELNVTIDRTQPARPSAPDLRTLDDKGSSSTDNLTNITTPVFTGTAEPGSTVTLYGTDGFMGIGSAVASGGNWSITSSSLTSGDHTLTVRAVDKAGNVSEPSTKLTVTIDTTAPAALALDRSTVAAFNAGSGATIANISATDTHAVTYALAVGNGSNNADNGSFTISGNTLVANGALTAGNYKIYLSATDAAGNVSNLAQTIAVVNAPSVVSIIRAGGASATVASNAPSIYYTVTFSEGVNGVTRDDFMLTAATGDASGDIVTVFPVGGSTSVYTVVVDTLGGDGNLRLDLKGSGTNIQSIGSSTDIIDGYTVGSTYVLDHTKPDAPSRPTMTSATDSGSSPVDGITASTTPVFTGSGEAGATVRLYDTNGTTMVGNTTVDGSGNWAITNATLTSGSHRLTVRQTDAAGNESDASGQSAVVIDNTAPVSLALSSTKFATQKAVAHATIGTLSATDSTDVTYALVRGAGSNGADNNSFAIVGNVLTVNGSPLSSGAYQVYVAATDAAGNVSHLVQTITVANAPSVNNISRTGGASANVLTVSNSISYTVTFNEAVTGVTTDDFTLTKDGDASGNIASISGSGAVYTVVVDTLVGDGELRLDLNGVDTGIKNANGIEVISGYFSGASYRLDHTHPAALPSVIMTSATDTGELQTDGITGDDTPTFSGVSEAGAIVRLYDTNRTTIVGFTIADSSGNWSITSDPLSEGSHELTVRQFDRAGNASVASLPTTVVIDTTAPTALALSNTIAATQNAVANATIGTLSASDSNTLKYALVNGPNGEGADNVSFAVVGSALTVGSASLTNGDYQVYLSVTDAAGNISYLAQTITVANPPAVSTIGRAEGASADVAADAESIRFTVTFSEDVTGVTADDFTLTNSDTAAGRIVSVTGSGSVYTVEVDSLAGDGILRLDLNGGSTGIRAGNTLEVASGYFSGANFVLDHTVPDAPSAATMTPGTDTGSLQTDGITRSTTPTFTGTSEAGATVRLYDTDGTTELGSDVADGSGNWSIASSTLTEGDHTLTVRQTDAAGNESAASGELAITIDTSVDIPAAPTLAVASDSGLAGDGITNDATPTIEGTADAGARVTLFDTDGMTELGTTTADENGVWQIVSSTLIDGSHTLQVRQTDLAGNVSDLSSGLTLLVDATPPAVLDAPVLAAASDSGAQGDNITLVNEPVLNGTAAPDALVQLYGTDGTMSTTLLGSTIADGSGNWSITSSVLAVGTHTLSARQTDAAGNVSSAGATLALTIQAPPVTPPTTPPNLVDGVAITQQQVTLPGGGVGTQIVVPIVTNTRTDDSGNASVADIPLVTSGGNTLLMAQLPVGFGLTATGGPSAPAGDPLQQLIRAIIAATPSHSTGDQGHLTSDGVAFLDQQPTSLPLLVQTIAPITGSSNTSGVLTLTGTSTNNQHTALVIDTQGMGSGASLQLNAVDFAAIIGAGNVTGSTGGQILTGDQAAQRFTVAASDGSNVFSGGGSDTLVFNSAASVQAAAAEMFALDASPVDNVAVRTTAVPTVTSVLHGGLSADTAVFNGASTDYTIERHQSYITVSANAQPQQQAVLINVENLRFTDTTVSIEHRDALTSIAGLYRDALGRQADYLGIDFWAQAEESGVSLGRIALDILASAEAQSNRPGVFTGNAAQDIELLYQGIFSRASDADGLAFWTDAMAQGVSLEQVATFFMTAPEMADHQIGAAQWDFSMA